MIESLRRNPYVVIVPYLIFGIIYGEYIAIERPVMLIALLLTLLPLMRKIFPEGTMEFLIPPTLFFVGIIIAESPPIETFQNLCNFETIKLAESIHPLRDYLTSKNVAILGGGDEASLANGICLGERSGVRWGIKTLFRECGTSHLLAVSGLHVGIFYILISLVASLCRIRRRLIPAVTIPTVWLYALLTGLSPSVVRASLILTFITLGRSLRKGFTSLNGIAICAFFTLLVTPGTLYNIGFQLSYLAYAGILLALPLFLTLNGEHHKSNVSLKSLLMSEFIGEREIVKRPILERIRREERRRRRREWALSKIAPLGEKLLGAIGASVAAQLATLPLILYYFHTVSLNALLVNLVAVPLTTLLLYCDIFTLLLPTKLGLLLEPVAKLPGVALIATLEKFQNINHTVSELYPTATETLIYYIVIITAFLSIYSIFRKKFSYLCHTKN